MSLSDPIGDMIARVKNAQSRNHKKVDLPSSNFKSKIADILKNEGFIKDFKISSEEKKNILSLDDSFFFTFFIHLKAFPSYRFGNNFHNTFRFMTVKWFCTTFFFRFTRFFSSRFYLAR